ncbi:kinase-like domain-containing protein [Mycena olivaceomarginata]|nr:kinase-like domain-containing protein [Mycena olivaceomarginata]
MFFKLNINIQKLVFKRKGASALVDAPTPASLSRCPSIDDFEYLSLLGTGTTCSVYLVREISTGGLFALKQAAKLGQPADIHQERDILRSISALPDAPKSLLALDASWSDADFYYLLTPWCEGGDLEGMLRNDKKLDGHRVQIYMAQLTLAVEALHCLDVIHRDIKPKNIFVAKDGNVVLGDLGFAKFAFEADPEATRDSFVFPTMDELYITDDPCGTFDWMSPAQHIGNPYSFDADAWALGLVMYRMLTGRPAFGLFHDPWAQVSAFAFDEVNFRPEDAVDPVAQELVRGLLAKKTHERTTIAQAKVHTYFHGVDWTAAAQHKGPATWAPKEAVVPKEASAGPLVVGRAYAAGQCGLPGFVFVKPGFYGAPAVPVKEVAPKIAGVSSWRGKSAGTKKETETTAAEAQSPVKYDLDSGYFEVSLEAPVEAKEEKHVPGTSSRGDGSDSLGIQTTPPRPSLVSTVCSGLQSVLSAHCQVLPNRSPSASSGRTARYTVRSNLKTSKSNGENSPGDSIWITNIFRQRFRVV